MRKTLILHIIGLVALCAFFLLLRGCNDRNTPTWVMQGISALQKPGSEDGKAADQKAEGGQEASFSISQAPVVTPAQEMEQPAQTSILPEETPAAAAAPSPAPTATIAPQEGAGAAIGEEREGNAEESTVPDTPSDTQAPVATPEPAPSPELIDPDAAPLPKDTAVMDGDAAELSENEIAFERELFNTSPMIKGDDVKLVQTALNARGFHVGEVDGKFGPKTEKAVKTYQLYHEIYGMNDEAYGHVDETTWNWLF